MNVVIYQRYTSISVIFDIPHCDHLHKRSRASRQALALSAGVSTLTSRLEKRITIPRRRWLSRCHPIEVGTNFRRLAHLRQTAMVLMPVWRLCAVVLVMEHGRQKKIPCRHIPVNEHGETLYTLCSTSTIKEIQAALRGWLHKAISRLEQEIPAKIPWVQRKAS